MITTTRIALAVALIVEVGGLMCHAAVVAREMGIPAVFGLRHATTTLVDGEVVEVDGERGTVTRNDPGVATRG